MEEKISIPDFKLIAEGNDITKDIRDYVIEIEYSDATSESDQLKIVLDNSTKEFTTTSYPEPNIELILYIKEPETGDYIYCGTFKKEKLTRGLYLVTIEASSINKEIEIKQTIKNRRFKNTSLTNIIKQIAKENGLKAEIQISKDIKFTTINQHNQTDSQFLEKLARKYSCYLKITPNKLYFIEQTHLEEAEPVLTIHENDLIDISIEDMSETIYKKAVIYYHDSIKNKDILYQYDDPGIPSGEILKINERAKDLEEAKRIAMSKLKEVNKFRISGEIVTEGNPLLVAGANLYLETSDNFSGKYFIEQSIHTIGQDGYKTRMKIRKI